MESWNILLQIILLLLACLIAGSIMAWFRQSPLVGYLLAGMLIGGPGSLAIVHADNGIEAIAELGVALLLFSLGLEFSWNRVMGLGKRLLLTGAAQVVVTLLLASAVCLGFGFSLKGAIAIGAMVCLSSTATVLRVLVDRGEMDSLAGRNSLAVLLVQDMAVVPLAILIPLLAEGGDFNTVMSRIGGIATAAVAVVGTLYFVLNYVAIRALQTPSFARNRELTVLLSVVIGLGATWAAHAAKLSPALGAFVAGMFLGNSKFAVQIRADVASIRIVLLTLFFGAVGMVADPVWMVKNMPLILSVTIMILTLKAVVLWGLFRMAGQANGTALATSLCLCQVGEFAFVLGGDARAGGLLTKVQYSALVSSSIVTLMMTPFLIAAAPRLMQWKNRRVHHDAAPAPNAGSGATGCDVLVVGFGPAGRGAVSQLTEFGKRVLVVDLNANGVAAAESMGFRAVIGDASSGDVLEHLHLEHVRIVVVTLPSRQDALLVMNEIRAIAPQAALIVRSRYEIHMDELRNAGADVVLGDEDQVSHALAESVSRHAKELLVDASA
jgi:CPA2 family monovalent cation:H+ antiporter-2